MCDKDIQFRTLFEQMSRDDRLLTIYHIERFSIHRYESSIQEFKPSLSILDNLPVK